LGNCSEESKHAECDSERELGQPATREVFPMYAQSHQLVFKGIRCPAGKKVSVPISEAQGYGSYSYNNMEAEENAEKPWRTSPDSEYQDWSNGDPRVLLEIYETSAFARFKKAFVFETRHIHASGTATLGVGFYFCSQGVGELTGIRRLENRG
jgi:hypothetical protein